MKSILLNSGWMVLVLVGWLPAASSKPDMLIYLSDDHSRRDCSVYGATDIPTPNMQKLAESGLVFDRAFIASPACAPSRAAMLTGLMPARNGAEANHTFPRPDIQRLPRLLKALGYEVAAFGKVAHGNDAARNGFDVIRRDASCPALKKNVTAYLKKRTSDRPLCLFVGTSNPHVPWALEYSFDPNRLIIPPTHIDTPSTREHRAMYYQEIKDLDILLGDLRRLAERHLGHDTLFIYTSDHGAQWPFGKWNLYDEGIRTPFIVAWPGVVRPGTRTDAMISWVDLLPTLIELAGGTPPSDLDGRSFAQVLRDPRAAHRNRIFTTHSGDGNKNVYPIRAVRTDRYKYIWNLHPEYAHTNHSDLLLKVGAGAYWRSWIDRARIDPAAEAIVKKYYARPAEELYDLQKDPWEQHNLADQPEYQQVRQELRAELEDWMRRQGDRKTVFNTPRLLSQPETYAIGADIE